MKSESSDLLGKENGGVFLLANDINPWFVHNTTEIKYCLKIDQANFGVSRERARKSFLGAYAFWQKQFLRANSISDPEEKGYVHLGTASLAENCESPHLQILFGVLDSEQSQKLSRPTGGTLAETVRLGYENLVGSGFIYISPESGPLAPNVEIQNRWRRFEGRFLDVVMIHEVAHLFRLDHIKLNHPHLTDMFSEEFYVNALQIMDLIDRSSDKAFVEKLKLRLLAELEPRDYFAHPDKPYFYRTCWPASEDTAPLKLRRDYKCLALFLGSTPTLAGSDSPNGPWEAVAVSHINNSSGTYLPWTKMIVKEEDLDPKFFDVHQIKKFSHHNRKSGEFIFDVYPRYNYIGNLTFDFINVVTKEEMTLQATQENGKLILNYVDPDGGMTTVFAANFWKQIDQFPAELRK